MYSIFHFTRIALSALVSAIALTIFTLSSIVSGASNAQAQSVEDNQMLPGSSGLPGYASLAGDPLAPVDKVDIDRYAGKWYQLAAIPQPFNLQCHGNTTAEYSRISPTAVSVRNRCTTWLGQESGIDGRADVVDKQTGAALRVTFPSVPFQNVNGPANYIVTYLDDYELAVVGNAGRTSGFILSRSPQISAAEWTAINRIVADRGWWPCLFFTTPQEGGLNQIQPICLQ